MADLSNLLGDVYGDADGPPVAHEPAAAERQPKVPEWADDAHLDEAFSGWAPEPSPGLPEVEAVATRTELSPPKDLDDDLAAALSAALAAAPPSSGAAASRAAPTLAPPPDSPLLPPPPPAPLQVLPEEDDKVSIEDFFGSGASGMPPEPARRWQRSDDDILPVNRKRRGLTLFRRK